MRFVLILCALAVATASSPKVLTYVSCDKADSLRDNFTVKDQCLIMKHYWEKTAAWVCNQQKRSFPMTKFDDEYAKFESHYFRALPSVVANAMNIDDAASANRMMSWMWFTE